jgi:hypothetical protein
MGFQYQTSTGEGAIMSAYDSLAAGQGFLSFYTKRTGQPITQRMVIDYAGNVGINKPNPGTALDVNGTVTATGFVGPGLGLTGVVPADNSVTSAKIVDGQVQNADLANNSVTSGKILDGTILGADLAPGSVDTLNLANNSVTSAKILDGTILNGDLADNSVNAAKIVDGSVGTLDLANGAVTSVKIADGTIVAADLAYDVASLDKVSAGRMTLSGNRVILPSLGTIDTNLFTGLGFQYYASGEGAIMSSYANGYGYLSFYTKQGSGYPITQQVIIDKYGGVAMDQAEANDGVLHHYGTAGVGLTFGVGSGEGVASKRTDGGNKWGLDFYTGYLPRMNIANGGNVGIGTTAPTAKLHVAGTAGTDGIKFPDGTLQTTAPFPQMNAGSVESPATTNRFLGPTVTVTVRSSSQRILVSANSAMGTTVGAANLRLYPGYRLSGSTAAPTSVDGGMWGIAVTANVRVPLGITGVITGLAPGTYAVGMVGYCPAQADANNWNNNEWGYVTATLY